MNINVIAGLLIPFSGPAELCSRINDLCGCGRTDSGDFLLGLFSFLSIFPRRHSTLISELPSEVAGG